MKDKLLKAEIETALERLLSAVRKYSGEQVYVDLCFFTRDEECADDDFPNEIPDYYTYRVQIVDKDASEDLPVVPILSESGRIYYSTDDGEERVLRVIPYGTPKEQKGGES